MTLSYALPTKDEQLRPLSLDRIRGHVARFLEHAAEYPSMRYQVTRLGCGLAGYRDEVIAPMFADVPKNVGLPGIWKALLGQLSAPRLIIAGSRDIVDPQVVARAGDRWTSETGATPVVVSGTARGVDRLGERWAEARGYDVVRFPAEWDRYPKEAGYLRNEVMGWYSTHLLAVWDGVSPGTRAMIAFARREGLDVQIAEPEVRCHARPAMAEAAGLQL